VTHLAIVGPMHSGKTTLANILVEEHGYTRIGLADAVKDAAEYMLNSFITFNLHHFPDRQDALGGPRPPILIDRQEIEDAKTTFRPLLQWLGTDFARQYLKNDRCWIEMFLAKLRHAQGPVVCDDVRFPNEADALREAGFTIVRITRPEEDRLGSIGSPAQHLGQLSHTSETEARTITSTFTIPNSGSVADLSWLARRHFGTAVYAGVGDDTTGHD
jgi:hypothetical protein